MMYFAFARVYLEIFLAVGLIAGFRAWIYPRIAKRYRRRIAIPDPDRTVDLARKAVIEKALNAHGRSTNSIIHLYGDLCHFEAPGGGLIGYVRKGRARVIVPDPLCSTEQMRDSLGDFIGRARAEGFDTFLFAVGKETAAAAEELGYESLKIGQEPVFDLRKWRASELSGKIRSTIRQVFAKGVTIERLTSEQLRQPGIANSLNEVLHQWITARRCDQLKLLSAVNPFSNPEHKAVFVARQGGWIEAFLSCSEIPGRNGWFLHDLVRRPTALNGVTEALVVSALEAFQAEGKEFASLGIASLAGLDGPGVNARHPRMNRLLKLAFNHYSLIVNFKQLYAFKRKFNPTHEEPSFFCFPKSRLKLRHLKAALDLFSDQSILSPITFRLRQWKEGVNLPSPVARWLDPDLLCLPPLPGLSAEQIFSRLKFTLSMIGLNVYTYVFTSDLNEGILSKQALHQLGFSYASFMQHKWFILVTSNFMHFNSFHLATNMILLALVGGCLEALAGMRAAALCYFVSMFANVPNGFFLLLLLKLLSPELWSSTVNFIDVGASLGVVGCLGGCCALFRRSIGLGIMSIAIAISLALAVGNRELIGFDHAFAAVIGYFFMSWWLRRRRNLILFSASRIQFLQPGRRPARGAPVPGSA